MPIDVTSVVFKNCPYCTHVFPGLRSRKMKHSFCSGECMIMYAAKGRRLATPCSSDGPLILRHAGDSPMSAESVSFTQYKVTYKVGSGMKRSDSGIALALRDPENFSCLPNN